MTERDSRMAASPSELKLAQAASGERTWHAGGQAVPLSERLAVPWWALLSAALSPVLLTVGWLVADTFQPASYSPMHQTVSVLAGHTGAESWIMTTAMLLAGGTYLATAAGMAGLWLPARTLLAVAGVCSIGIATSPEPATGPTAVHLAWTIIGAATIAIWPATVGWHAPAYPIIANARSSAIVTVVFAGMVVWVLAEISGGHDLGLAERLTASVQTSWPFVVAVAGRRAAGGGLQPSMQIAGPAGVSQGRVPSAASETQVYRRPR